MEGSSPCGVCSGIRSNPLYIGSFEVNTRES